VDNFLESLKLKKMSKDTKVFDYGDRGKEFYVIMQGAVSIQVPLEE